MLTIEQLEVAFGEHKALSIQTPVDIKAGDRIGIIGSNGAGKSTLVKAVLGLVKYKGSIRTNLSLREIAVHMQQNHYVKTMSVKHIMEAILNTDIKQNKKLMELIDFFQFEGSLKKRFHTLSGGQQQRLTIILVLMQDAPLTFFDEVTSGLDFETRQKLMGKITDWYQGKHTGLCVVSHYYDELERLVNKLLILDKGKLVDFGKAEDLFSKYCGRSIVTIEHTEESKALTKEYARIEAPQHLLAFPCRNNEEEWTFTKMFTEHNINYKRSNNDFEIMYVNALKQFNSNNGGTGK
ncbi:ATP-binding cassette domain-containing protein [Bacillus sp. 1P06AnD]|uniref:ATP-binding cassette domain-containing protein n=1 Tax=Bacillus sp. 1P06AnD TaxID=3132208 RepID=UPI0039A1A009